MKTDFTIEDYQQAVKKVERLKREEAQIEGSILQIKKQMKSQLGCEDLEEIKVILGEKKEKLNGFETLIKEQLSVFEKKYGDLLR